MPGSVARLLPLLAAALLALPAAAGAQLPPRAGLLPPGFAAEPERVPGGPIGEYPDDWARCVRVRNPAPPVLPPGIDPRGVDRRSPNPLLGLTWFVDRMEPAYVQWRRWRRSGRTERATQIWRLPPVRVG